MRLKTARGILRSWLSCVLLSIGLLGIGPVRGVASDVPKELPVTFAISKGSQVLFLGDSIVAPGMFSHVANQILDNLYPGHGITFHSKGRPGTTALSIVPQIKEYLAGEHYDWVIINFGHNDAVKFTPAEFREHAHNLVALVRKYHKGKIAWMSLIGSEVIPCPDDPKLALQRAHIRKDREHQARYVKPVKALCREVDLVYVPLHEKMQSLFDQLAQHPARLAITVDTVHPNLLGNWIVGATILQSLGLDLKPGAFTVKLLQADSTAAMGRRPVNPLQKPVPIAFTELFLHIQLIPAPSSTLLCALSPRPISVDGKLGDWPGIAAVTIRPPQHVTMESKARCVENGRYEASVQTCRDEGNLYFAFQVLTPNLTEENSFPEIVELFLDARKDTVSKSGSMWHRTKGLTQYAFHRDFSENAPPEKVEVMANSDKSQAEGVRAAAAEIAGGYVVEVAIPISNFKQVKMEAGTRLPMDWAVSYSDQALNLDWMGLMSRSSSTFGYGWLALE